jgi:hypothetical protein
MSDVESEQTQNDFEIEISHVDKPDVADNSSKPVRPSASPLSSPRRRRLQLTITAAIVILTVILIMATTAPVRELVRGAFIHPALTPTPSLFPGVDLFYIQGTPPWGHLSIDGHSIARLPRISIDPPFRLTRGQHMLVWSAEPFQAQRCTVSIPARYGTDTCFYKKTATANSELAAWVITFSESLVTLSGDLRIALIQAAQAALDAQPLTDTVQPGELYALPPQNPACQPAQVELQCYATAKQPLKATLSFQVDTDAVANAFCAGPQPSCTFLYQNCHLFCTGSALVSSASQEWNVIAPVRSLWKFTTLEGRILVSDVPDNIFGDSITGQSNDEALLELSVTWENLEWHVAVLSSASVQNTDFDPLIANTQNSIFLNPTCGSTQDEVGPLEPPADANGPLYLQWQFMTGLLPAPGCLAVGTPRQVEGITPTPTYSPPFVAYCLHRFGVLLAANNMAHHSWPYLPLADAYEQHMAKQLAALIPGSST